MGAKTTNAAQQHNVKLAQCWRTLQEGRSIALYCCLIDLTGSIKSAVMLSQLLYWTRVGTQVEANDGYILKTIAQMQAETGLSKREQSLCKNKLQALGLIETNRNRTGGSLAYRVKLDQLAQLIIGEINNIDHTPSLTLTSLRNQSSAFVRQFLGERISYHRDLVDLTGDIHSALMFSAIIQESIKHCANNKQRAFVSHTAQEWQKKLKLSYKQQKKIRDKLNEKGLIIERHYIASRRIFTLTNGNVLLRGLQKINNVSNSLPKKAISVCRKGQVFENLANISKSTPVTSEVTKGQIQKLQKVNFGSNKRENSEVTKGQIIKYTNYSKLFTSVNNNYNKESVASPIQAALPVQQDVVVVNDDIYCKLIYPKILASQENRKQAIAIMQKYLPQASQELLQNILDEIAGQSNLVHSPLGLLLTLCKKAAIEDFIPIKAVIVQNNRKRMNEIAAMNKQNAATSVKIKENSLILEEANAIRSSLLHRMKIRQTQKVKL